MQRPAGVPSGSFYRGVSHPRGRDLRVSEGRRYAPLCPTRVGKSRYEVERTVYGRFPRNLPRRSQEVGDPQESDQAGKPAGIDRRFVLMPSTAVVYTRVSSREQKEGFSLAAQRELLDAYARERRLKVAIRFEEGDTAKSGGKRFQFGRMVDYLRDHPGTALLVEKTDRLYRNLKDWITLDDLKVEIHLVKEGEVISPDSHSSRKFMHGIKVLMAKNYVENLSEEIRKGMTRKAEEGAFPSAAPIGYGERSSTGAGTSP
jgi:DNA invertase Pin-like site-specific DNA recombinase